MAATFHDGGIRLTTNTADFHTLLFSRVNRDSLFRVGQSTWFDPEKHSVKNLHAVFGLQGIRLDVYWAEPLPSEQNVCLTGIKSQHCNCKACYKCVIPEYGPIVPCMRITPRTLSGPQGQVHFGCDMVHCGPACGSLRLFVRPYSPEPPAAIFHGGDMEEFRLLVEALGEGGAQPTTREVADARITTMMSMCSPDFQLALIRHNLRRPCKFGVYLDSLAVMYKAI
jgi:hypothetical protein